MPRTSASILKLRPACAILLALAAWLLSASAARAATTVRILETWPPGDRVTLSRGQNFYLRLAYETDAPVGIWLKAYANGEPADVGSNPSPRYSGSGETFAWFFFMEPGDEVDEIRITAGDGRINTTPVVAVWRGRITGGDAAAHHGEPPAWVGEMSGRAKAAQDEDYRARMSEPVRPADTALATGFMLTMLALGLAGLAGPAWGVWRWQGGWRVAAAVPAAVMAFVVLRILFDTARDPTSHNLWPFEIIMAGLLSAAVMALLGVARKIFGREP
jgi:hypothetical protein